MNKAKMLFLLIFIISSTLYAGTTRKNVKVLETSEDIKFISQKIANEYFYLSKRELSSSSEILSKIVLNMDKKLRDISRLTKNKNTRNMLEFLLLSNEDIGSITSKAYSMENAALIVEFSDVLLEGAMFLSKENSYEFSREEKMLIRIKNMMYLLERINKYYMSYHYGFINKSNTEQLYKAIDNFDNELNIIKEYQYQGDEFKDYESIVSFWRSIRILYFRHKNINLQNIIYISTAHLSNLINNLSLYHSKNQ